MEILVFALKVIAVAVSVLAFLVVIVAIMVYQIMRTLGWIPAVLGRGPWAPLIPTDEDGPPNRFWRTRLVGQRRRPPRVARRTKFQ